MIGGNEVESKPEYQEDHATGFIRLDNRSKISLMAAVIYGLADTQHLSEEEALKKSVEDAFSLDRMVGDKLRRLKKERQERIVKTQ